LRVALALLSIIFIASLPWIMWSALRSAWLRWKERQVLADKYGDLQMFSKRLEEWGVIRSKRADGERVP